jgi:hypothetical protein
MTDIGGWSLIRFLDFYLVLLFFAGLLRRLEWYRSVLGIVFRVPGRWPKLFDLAKQHRTIFLTWQTVLPAILTAALAIIQLTASRLIWPGAAQLTVATLADHWVGAAFALPLGFAMIAVDVYFLIVIGRVDRQLVEKQLDQAEFWLKSRAATVVRIFTLGFVNPRKLVNDEVRKALTDLSKQLNVSLWWMVVQIGLRIAFGLSLWLTWGYIAVVE